MRRLMVDPSQRRLIFAVKVGIATMLTTLLTLVDDVYAFNELGAWATITVVITMQPTVGSTTNKGIQRCLGTVFAAAVAALVGVSARELLPWPEAGKVVVGLAVGSVTVPAQLAVEPQPQPSPSPSPLTLTTHHSPFTLALTRCCSTGCRHSPSTRRGSTRSSSRTSPSTLTLALTLTR